MKLQKIKLKNYRSYEHLIMEPDSALNVLVGQNAAGKTNLLESIHYLATGKSHRTPRDAELVQWYKDAFYIGARVRGTSVSHRIECAYEKNRGKVFKLNGVTQKRLSDVVGTINTVLFSPDDLYLIKGGPDQRRNLLDSEIGQISKRYRRALSRFRRILSQRNDVLKKSSRSSTSRSTAELMLSPWEEQFAEVGGMIVAIRLKMLRDWSFWASQKYHEVAGSDEKMSINYVTSFGSAEEVEGKKVSEMKEWAQNRLLEFFAHNRESEIERGYTMGGPQRDDVNILINGKDARRYASQGQQRSAILALRIAEVPWMKHETGKTPVLLLDDVMSELDVQRAKRLAEILRTGGQTFITCTDLSEVRLENAKKIWRVFSGEVRGPVS